MASFLTPPLLLRIRGVIRKDTRSPIFFRLAAWSCILAGFYHFLRKSNLTATPFTKHAFQLILAKDVSITKSHVWIKTQWSKTNNFRDRSSLHATRVMTNSPLCLGEALRSSFKMNRIKPHDHAFAYLSNGRLTRMHDTVLQAYFKKVIARIGQDPNSYSLHSLRAGGATFAFEFGLPRELIQHRGDWKSLAYLRYIEFSDRSKKAVANRIADAITHGISPAHTGPVWQAH